MHLFISYASADQAIATEVCALLEARGVSCWIAPRDVTPGSKWDESILDAIEAASAFLLVLTNAANESSYVSNEVNEAFEKKKTIFTFRAEDVAPGKSLKFYLGRHHWIDGFPPPRDDKVARLAAAIAGLPAPREQLAARAKARRLPWRRIAGYATSFLMGALVVGLVAWPRWGATCGEQSALYLTVPLPGGAAPPFLALSPDGRRLVIKEPSPGPLVIYSLDTGETRALKDTTTARTPFWSPDGATIAFFEDGALKTVSASGGPLQTLCAQVGSGGGGSWSRDGGILLATDRGELKHVVATGGSCTDLAPSKAGARTVSAPAFLPDGDHFLYVRDEGNQSGLFVASLTEPMGHRLLADRSSAEFVPDTIRSATGHILFARDGTLMSQTFDSASLRLSGEPTRVAEQVEFTSTFPKVELSSTFGGTVVYLANGRPPKQLVWYDRAGKPLGVVAKSGTGGGGVSLSPDGKHVVFMRADDDAEAREQRLVDFESGRDARLFNLPNVAAAIVWSPDAGRIVYHRGGGTAGLYVRSLTGGNDELLLADGGARRSPSNWSRDGRWLVYTEDGSQTQGDIWLLPAPPAQSAPRPIPLLRTAADESQGQISPDGRWLAYTSNESGSYQVYLRAFAGPAATADAAWPVSASGGMEPRWRADGKELYFWVPIMGTRRFTLMAVSIDAGANPVGRPGELFEFQTLYGLAAANAFTYSPSPDGQRFLVNVYATQAQPSINVILNWPASLRK